MVESQSLRLVFAAARTHEQIARYLSEALDAKGYESATPSTLNFLSALECGENYGSEIARSLGVSRQMVAKTVKELCRVGYLEQIEGAGKQKQILFTQRGEELMADSRKLLAKLDTRLSKKLGKSTVKKTVEKLEAIRELMEGL